MFKKISFKYQCTDSADQSTSGYLSGLFSMIVSKIPLRRVPFETSFGSKQPKLVSALSETKGLFRLYRFYVETASFGVSFKPKLTGKSRKISVICIWNCLS
jgi:hypothetical protein